MDRRGFLGRITAAAAAFTALRSTAVAVTPKPRAVVLADATKPRADTTKFEKAIGDAGREVVEMLKQCRVVQIDRDYHAGSIPTVTATFKTASPGTPRTHLDDLAWECVERGHLTAVWVSCEQDWLDDINENYRPIRTSVQHKIEATWLVPNL